MKLRTLFILFLLPVVILCPFTPANKTVEESAWVIAFGLAVLFWATERRLDRATADPRIGIKFINGPSRWDQHAPRSDAPDAPRSTRPDRGLPRVELRGAPPRSPYHSRGAQS